MAPLRLARSPIWRNPDYVRLWSAETISELGSQVTILALPFVAILTVRATAFDVAALTVVEYVPWLLFSLPVGVLADRLERRPIMIIADWGRAAVLASVPIAYAAGALTLGQLYGVGFVAGSLTVLFDVSYQSYLPSVVESEQLAEGNTKLTASASAAQVAGPGLAGVLVRLFSAPYAIAADVVSFVLSAVLLSAIRRGEQSPARHPAGWAVVREEIVAGLRFVAHHPIFRPSMLFLAVRNFFMSMVSAVVLVFAVRTLHLSAATIGLVLSLSNLSFLAGPMTIGPLTRRLGVGRTLIAVAFFGGAGLLLLPVAPAGATAIAFVAVAYFVYGFYAFVYQVVSVTLYQEITPAHLLGRMNASRRFVMWSLIPAGGLVGGALASTVGLRDAMWVATVGVAVSIVPLMSSRLRAVSDRDAAADLVRSINERFAPT